MSPPSPCTADEFADEVLRAFMSRIDSREVDNVDKDYPPFGLTRPRASYDERRAAYLRFLVREREPLFQAYQLWQDDASRLLFFSLLLYRALGHERMRLPSNTAAFWEAKHSMECLPSSPSELASMPGADELRHFELPFEDQQPCRIDCLPMNIMFTFLLRQYHLRREELAIQPAAGDHVIDAGACLGDTAIDFARAVGEGGRIHAFEVVDSHLRVIRYNLEQNPSLSTVVVHPVALSDRSQSGEIAALGIDPGFSVSNDIAVPLRLLDDIVEAGEIERVDLIKMDIEGHELHALRGAEETLRRFRPRLAISLYHNWDDYFRIPLYLDDLDLGYRFYLENYTITDGETIMYAVSGPL